MDYCIVEKLSDSLNTISCDSSLSEQIAARIFPYGSFWGKYRGRRSFKLVRLSEQNSYLLSYTLIVEDVKTRALLRAWGILGKQEEILRLLTSARGVADIFQEQKDHFKRDPLFHLMYSNLQEHKEGGDGVSLRKGCGWWMLLVWYFLGGRLVVKAGKNALDIEKVVWELVKSALWKGKWLNRIPTFCTFSLSTNEPSQIVVLPEDNM